MKYTVREEDIDMSVGGLNSLFEIATVIIVVVLCSVITRLGYGEYGILIGVVTIGYCLMVAYVKLMFSRLKVGETYEIERTSFGACIHVDKRTIVWIPVLVFKSIESKLNLYMLTLSVKEVNNEKTARKE